jgi:Spy/CpxP family protein refolding chaperone
MKNLKPILVLILVFAAGAVVGSVATRRVAIGMVRRAIQNPEFMRERAHKEMERRLGLNPEQEKQVDAIFADTQRQLWELRRKNQPEFFGIMSNSQYRISAQLTPEQREKFQRYRAENRRFLLP